MIKNVEIYGLQESIKASKYPMSVDVDSLNSEVTKGVEKLATSGIGEAHDQFLTGITVQFDLTATNKFWVEAERYRFLYFVSSQSTMHRATQFNIAEQCNEFVSCETIANVEKYVRMYKQICKEYGESSYQAKEAYLIVLYNMPAGFKLTARMTTNYRQLKTIYQQRKNHRLPEWREFCKWIETLPMSYFITGAESRKMKIELSNEQLKSLHQFMLKNHYCIDSCDDVEMFLKTDIECTGCRYRANILSIIELLNEVVKYE